ncbi:MULTISPECIES: hypothetical protein [Pseudomonas]|uniref:Uncharacterized protein n=1 Tax=Pseudomonas sp. Hg7Tf TaxID=3236988 RepID=A0AB39HWA5_9PSED|nr:MULTISPECIES: hypothetical protein [Pseudomonas]MDD1974816.1 hypothetical protein [Pseudomonas putida]MDH2559059.1 hypothetical protein [Pseudomonas sp. Hg5Tf]
MSSTYPQLAYSADLKSTLDKVQSDQVLGFAEYRLLQDSADAKLEYLLRRYEGQYELEQLRQTGIRMAHLLQSSCLALRKLDLDAEDKRRAREALEHQLASIQACLRRSMASFGEY